MPHERVYLTTRLPGLVGGGDALQASSLTRHKSGIALRRAGRADEDVRERREAMGAGPTDKTGWLDRIERAQEAWEGIVSTVGGEDMDRPDTAGN